MRVAMSPPDFFSVDYAINPWMDPASWQHDAAQLARDAKTGWHRLCDIYAGLGATIEIQPPAPGLPDLVFTANAAVVLNGIVLLARFRFPERRGEEAYNLAFFENLRTRGVVQQVVSLPDGVLFEGAGDAIWDPARQLFWTGHGQRSDPEAASCVSRAFEQKTHALRLVDPRFYHLDTCLCVLPGGEALHYPAAFDDAGRALLRAEFGRSLITVEEQDALTLSANAFPTTPCDVVFGQCSQKLESELAMRGYRVHRADLGSFARSGGSAFCLTLRLDGQSA